MTNRQCCQRYPTRQEGTGARAWACDGADGRSPRNWQTLTSSSRYGAPDGDRISVTGLSGVVVNVLLVPNVKPATNATSSYQQSVSEFVSAQGMLKSLQL